jgi:ABC-2 type transport system ATP-binding protein
MTPSDLTVLFDNVTKRYAGPHGEFAAVDGIDLTVKPGEIFGLLGPNGAGKTTSIEMLAGLRTPTSGTVRVLGLNPIAERDQLRQWLAIQPQQAALFEAQTVEELLRVWASFYPAPDAVDAVIDALGLTESRDVRTTKLSAGQRQRLLVGTALISKPRMLVLDEPSTGLDPGARQELWRAIRSRRRDGGTVLLSTHSMEEAATLCDRVAILHRGKVVACGVPADLVRDHAPEQEIAFTVSADADPQTLAHQEKVSHLTTEQVSDGIRVHLATTDTDALLGLITGRLAARQIHVKDAGLEGVFLKLTGSSFDRADSEEAA